MTRKYSKKLFDGRKNPLLPQHNLQLIYGGLTNLQKSFRDGVRWLFIENQYTRRSGRTNLLARVMIEEALLNINHRVFIADHHNSELAKHNLLQEIIREWDRLQPYFQHLVLSSAANYIRVSIR